MGIAFIQSGDKSLRVEISEEESTNNQGIKSYGGDREVYEV